MISALNSLLQQERTAATITPPAAPPSGAFVSYYSGNFIQLNWTNGDPLASTQLGQSDSPSLQPTSTFGSPAVPGATSKTTGTNNQCPYWWVRHSRNGQVTAWVLASDSNSRDDCLL